MRSIFTTAASAAMIAAALMVITPPAFARHDGGGQGNSGTPNGWSHGNKTGWQGGSTPPGRSRASTSSNAAQQRTFAITHQRDVALHQMAQHQHQVQLGMAQHQHQALLQQQVLQRNASQGGR